MRTRTPFRYFGPERRLDRQPLSGDSTSQYPFSALSIGRFFVFLPVVALSFVDIAHADPADAITKQNIKSNEVARQQRIKDDEDHRMLSFTSHDAADKHFVFYESGSGRDAMRSLCKPSSCDVSYFINVMTNNASTLFDACPSNDGDVFPCIVDFEHNGDIVTKVISARKPQFDGVDINQAGSMVEGGKLCTSPWSAFDDTHSFGCLNGEAMYI